MNNLLKQELESAFKGIAVSIPEDTKLIIDAKKEQIMAILRFLQDKGSDHLALVSCVDWIEEKEFELVHILVPYSEKKHVILKTRISRENAEFETAIHIFKNAEPYERELHELFGINFEGHPGLTPLFLEREYKIPPFRKDFDTRKYVEEVFGEIPFVEEKK